MNPRIVVGIPCYNEAATIAKVIDDFRAALADWGENARIIVFDNNSTDDSADIARRHGAAVVSVLPRGKGNVVARMLDCREVLEGDYLVMVDGDDTYAAEQIDRLLEPLQAGQADMVIAARLADYADGAFRPLHLTGNRLVRRLINAIFHTRLSDILSGYRAMTAELARNLPVTTVGFEVETELTLNTLYYGYTIAEVQTPYRPRPAGSESKLHTVRDGLRVVWTVFNIFRSFKPLTFFGLLALAMALLSGLAALPAIVQYARTGLVRSWPLLTVGVGCAVISFASLTVGVLLHAINVRLKEMNALLRKIGRGGRFE